MNATSKQDRAPRQARSRDTERRLIEAAAAILEGDGLEGLSVARVVRDAKSSVGSFYARFADKDELLRAVHRSRMSVLLEQLAGVADSGLCRGIEASSLVSTCTQAMVAHYEEHPRLMAAFYTRSAADPQAWQEAVHDHVRLVDTIVRLLCQGEWNAKQGDLTRALTLAVHMVFSFLGDVSLHRHSVPDMLPFDAEELVPELDQMILGYVHARTGGVS